MTDPEHGHAPRADRYFAVVIGSGFGGAVTACRLAQATAAAGGGRERQICVLERGRRYGRSDFPRLALPDYLAGDPDRVTSKRVPEAARLLWSHDQGLWDLRNLGELRVGQAAGWGGGSLIYANVHLRPPQGVLGWPARCDPDQGECPCAGNAPPYSREGLKAYYDLVASMLQVQPLPRDAPGTAYPKTEVMERAAAEVLAGAGTRGRLLRPPLAITFDRPAGGRNAFGAEQGACNGCGNCTIGCQEAAKNTLDLNYLALAERTGQVDVRTLCEARWLHWTGEPGDPIEVEYIDHLRPGGTAKVVADHVFLCAGAIGSTELLLRSSVRRPGAGVDREVTLRRPCGPRLGAGFFGNGDNLGVAFDTAPRVQPSHGPTITTALLHVGPRKQRWFLVEDGGIPPSLQAALGVMRSPLWQARNRFLPSRLGAADPPPAAAAGGGRGVLDGMVELITVGMMQLWRPPRPGAPEAPSPAAVLGPALRQLVPRALHPLLDDIGRADRSVRRELWGLTAAVLDLLDRRLKRRLITAPIAPVRPMVAGTDDVVEMAAEALAQRYPILRDLFARGRLADLALTVARYLLMGLPPTEHTAMLLVMGPDQRGTLRYDSGALWIEWDQGRDNQPLYSLQERVMRDLAGAMGGELRTNPDWTLGRTPLTVHAQGGCGMGARPADAVTRPCGQLWTCPRIHVMDAAAFPASVGVNPASTIAAVAERNVELFIRRELELEPAAYRTGAPPLDPALARTLDESLPYELPDPIPGLPRTPAVGFAWDERMNGVFTALDPLDPAAKGSLDAAARRCYRQVNHEALEQAEREARLTGVPVSAKLHVRVVDLDRFLLMDRPRMRVKGELDLSALDETFRQAKEPVDGWLVFDLGRPGGHERTSRPWTERRRLRCMRYRLRVRGGLLVMVKLIRDDPGLDVWDDLSTMYCRLDLPGHAPWFGVMRVPLATFVREQLAHMTTDSGGDPAAPRLDDVARFWAFARFGRFFVGSVKNAYSQWL